MHEIFQYKIDFVAQRMPTTFYKGNLQRICTQRGVNSVLDLVRQDPAIMPRWKGLGKNSWNLLTEILGKQGLQVGMTEEQIKNYAGPPQERAQSVRRLYEVVVCDAKEVQLGTYLGVANNLGEACAVAVSEAKYRNPLHNCAFHVRSVVEKGFIYFETPDPAKAPPGPPDPLAQIQKGPQ